MSFSSEVSEGLKAGKAVVVIESAGTFEGVVYPDNLRVAERIENIVRENGAVPAFAAVINGVIRIGLEESEKQLLANPEQPLLKASRRDIPFIIAKKGTALTAVAAAMMIADLAGIPVVAGGGIGGVHRDYVHCMDVSADLEEFSKSNVITVCSGTKMIMDLPFTFEYLETKAVPLAGYRTREFPAYVIRSSGLYMDHSMDTPEEAAEAYRAKNQLGIPGGIFIANPVPEEFASDPEEMEKQVEAAVKKAEQEGIKGKPVTRFILMEINDQTGSESGKASEELNCANAELAAQIARALAEQQA